jgi:hypothetical protein
MEQLGIKKERVEVLKKNRANTKSCEVKDGDNAF